MLPREGVKMGRKSRQDGGTFGLCLSYRNLGQEMMSRAGRGPADGSGAGTLSCEDEAAAPVA